MPCYDSCGSCKERGDSLNHHCDTCFNDSYYYHFLNNTPSNYYKETEVENNYYLYKPDSEPQNFYFKKCQDVCYSCLSDEDSTVCSNGNFKKNFATLHSFEVILFVITQFKMKLNLLILITIVLKIVIMIVKHVLELQIHQIKICLSCDDSKILFNKNCYSECPDGYYKFEGQCLSDCPHYTEKKETTKICDICPENSDENKCILFTN